MKKNKHAMDSMEKKFATCCRDREELTSSLVRTRRCLDAALKAAEEALKIARELLFQ